MGYKGISNEGYRERFKINNSVYESLTRSQQERECFGKDVIQTSDWLCHIGTDTLNPSVFVFGDSHSLSFLPAIDTALSKKGKGGLYAGTSGCIPFLSIHSLRKDQFENNCNEWNMRVFNYIKKKSIGTLFLVARWTYYSDGGYYGDNFSYLGINPTDERTQEISRTAFEYRLGQTLSSYADIGVNVVLVSQVPQQQRKPLDIYAESQISGNSLKESSVTRRKHFLLQDYVTTQFTSVGATTLDFTNIFCDESYCNVGNELSSFYYDDDHLSLTGSSLLVEPLTKFLSNSK